MAEGKVLAQGTVDEVKNDERVIEPIWAPVEEQRSRRKLPMAEPFLIGEAMTGGYGGADILHSCTPRRWGEIAVIVGPNGAGKSTTMKAVFGMLKLREGHVRLWRGYHRADPAGARRQGHGLCAANPQHFPSLTVSMKWAHSSAPMILPIP